MFRKKAKKAAKAQEPEIEEKSEASANRGDMGGERQDGFSVEDEQLLQHHGMGGLLRLGLQAASERKAKNRIIYLLSGVLVLMTAAVFGLSLRTIEPVVLSETKDGRIRPLPLLHEPIYSQEAIMSWADRCIRDIFDLSYVKWKEQIRNNTMCLSDRARQGFVDSLRDIGMLDRLNAKYMGISYAVPGKPVIRAAQASGSNQKRRYFEWVIDVPFVLHMTGVERGRISAQMSMRIVRVPMSMRDAGIWVEEYRVRPGEDLK